MAQIYIVQGSLNHNGQLYAPGSEFASDDEALVARLRRQGALALPAEALPAEVIAAREAEMQTRIAALEQQVAQATADKSGEDGEDGADSSEPVAQQ